MSPSAITTLVKLLPASATIVSATTITGRLWKRSSSRMQASLTLPPARQRHSGGAADELRPAARRPGPAGCRCWPRRSRGRRRPSRSGRCRTSAHRWAAAGRPLGFGAVGLYGSGASSARRAPSLNSQTHAAISAGCRRTRRRARPGRPRRPPCARTAAAAGAPRCRRPGQWPARRRGHRRRVADHRPSPARCGRRTRGSARNTSRSATR